MANALFDGYLCAAEYMLYGQTPYDQVIVVARDVQATAKRSGALRAAAFASALIGEAALLSGDLALAAAELSEASELHRDLGSIAGAGPLASSGWPRCAWPRATTAPRRQLLHEALHLARSSVIARHLLQRVFGTMILATPDPLDARAVVDRAESTMGWDDACLFCSIMLDVPARDRLRPGRRPRPRPPPPRAGRGVGAAVAGDVVGGRDGRGAGRGGGRRGRPRARRGPGCSRRPSSSSGPGSPSTRGAAARRSPPPDPPIAPDPTGRRRPPRPTVRPDAPVAPAAAGSCCDRRHPACGGLLTSPAGRTARGRCCRGRGTTARSRSRRP